jgi:hypothetical protein
MQVNRKLGDLFAGSRNSALLPEAVAQLDVLARGVGIVEFTDHPARAATGCQDAGRLIHWCVPAHRGAARRRLRAAQARGSRVGWES